MATQAANANSAAAAPIWRSAAFGLAPAGLGATMSLVAMGGSSCWMLNRIPIPVPVLYSEDLQKTKKKKEKEGKEEVCSRRASCFPL